MTTTTRLLARKPALSDAADASVAVGNAADDFDAKILAWYPQNIFSNRPAAGHAGFAFWATDTGILYYDDGSAWHALGAKPLYVDVTTFNGLTPTDGQEVYLIVDATNGIIWHLRYNAGSSSAYKWESVGVGAPLLAVVATSQSLASGSTWRNISTDGPYIAVPRAGDYDVEFAALAGIGGGTHEAYSTGIGAANGDTDPNSQYAPIVGWISDTSFGQGISLTGSARITGAAANDHLKLRYLHQRVSGSSSLIDASFQDRLIKATPIRIS